MTKLKKSSCGKTQKLKLLQNSKTQMETTLKSSNCDKTQKLKLWQNMAVVIVNFFVRTNLHIDNQCNVQRAAF